MYWNMSYVQSKTRSNPIGLSAVQKDWLTCKIIEERHFRRRKKEQTDIMDFYVCVLDSLLTWRHPASTKSLFFMLSVVTLASCFFNASTLFFMAGQSSTALRDSSVLFCETQLISDYPCPGRSVIHRCQCKVTFLPGRSVINSCQCMVTLLACRSVIHSSLCTFFLPGQS